MISTSSYCSEVDKRHFVCFQDCFIVRRKVCWQSLVSCKEGLCYRLLSLKKRQNNCVYNNKNGLKEVSFGIKSVDLMMRKAQVRAGT